MKDDGGPAFPARDIEFDKHDSREVLYVGMSLRAYLAGQALAMGALMAVAKFATSGELPTPAAFYETSADEALALADVMIERLRREETA